MPHPLPGIDARRCGSSDGVRLFDKSTDAGGTVSSRGGVDDWIALLERRIEAKTAEAREAATV